MHRLRAGSLTCVPVTTAVREQATRPLLAVIWSLCARLGTHDPRCLPVYELVYYNKSLSDTHNVSAWHRRGDDRQLRSCLHQAATQDSPLRTLSLVHSRVRAQHSAAGASGMPCSRNSTLILFTLVM